LVCQSRHLRAVGIRESEAETALRHQRVPPTRNRGKIVALDVGPVHQNVECDFASFERCVLSSPRSFFSRPLTPPLARRPSPRWERDCAFFHFVETSNMMKFFGTTMSTRTDVTFIPMLTVFALTAIATTVAHLLPPARNPVPLGLLLDFVPLAGVATATVLAARSFRRVSRSLIHLLMGVYGYFAGGLVGTFGLAHISAVTLVAIERAGQQQFVYTFRFYSLILLGVLLVVAGLMAIVQAGQLARGHRAGWRASLSVWTAILAINLPLVPLQRFAVLFSLLAALELLLLGATRRHFDVKLAGIHDDVTPY